MKIKRIDSAQNAYAYPLLIKSILKYSLVIDPEREIVYKDKSRYNYHEFNRRVRRLANVLKKLGLDGGESIAVMDYDSHRYLECYFAIPMTGNVLHTINWRLSPAQILYTINHAEDKVLIVNSDFLPIIESFADQMTTVKEIIIVSDNEVSLFTPLDITGKYENLMVNASDEYDFPDFDENAVATVFHTTGTTGNPKGVFFTHRQLVLHTLNLATSWGFIGSTACRVNSDDTYMPLTPMFHVHAWGFPFLATMFSMKQVYLGRFDPDIVIKVMRNEKPTFSHCVPTILQMLLTCQEAQQLDLSSWKVLVGGSALPKALAKRALEKKVDIITAYGMSETCPAISMVHIRREDKDRDINWQVDARTRTGIPLILVDMKINDEQGKPVDKNDIEMGEVMVRAPWLTQGYLNEKERGEDLWREGYLHTGDVATVNIHNSIKITDRIKDVIKTGGEWISSIELENIIGRCESVAEVAVVSVPDEKWGERPYALIVLKPGPQSTAKDIKKYLQQFVDNGQISKWAIPEHIEFTTSIPKTSVGKIDKKSIRANVKAVLQNTIS